MGTRTTSAPCRISCGTSTSPCTARRSPWPSRGTGWASTGCWSAPTSAPYRPGDAIHIGCYQIEPIRVTHSIADGIGLAIETPVGMVVHTGDFKLDRHPVDGEQADYSRFAALG